jgi:hypothetical protein
MLAARRRNRHSWLFVQAKKTPEMDNEQATFWLSQFIGKNLRIHASDGRVFGGQMKCTDKVVDIDCIVRSVLIPSRTATLFSRWHMSTAPLQPRLSVRRLKSRETHLHLWRGIAAMLG